MSTPALLYRLLLNLYPAAFRATYADEMAQVFSLALTDAAQEGPLAYGICWLHESLTLPGSVLQAHWHTWQQHRQDPAPNARFELAAARWLGRIAGLLVLSVFLVPMYQQPHMISHPLFPATALGGLGILLVWRWERLGSLLLITGGLAAAAGYFSTMLPFGSQYYAMGVLGGMIWALPMLLFGGLFFTISRRAQTRGLKRE